MTENKPAVNADTAKKPPVINKALKNFFFYSLKGKREFKDAQKQIGTIESVSIIITPERTFMRATCGEKKVDTEFTPEEKAKMLKTFKVKEETVNACKSIFVVLDMINKNIHIQQNKLDGSKKEITI